MKDKPAVQIDTIRLGEKNPIHPDIQKAINEGVSIAYDKANVFLPSNQLENKTITYTEKDFKEMVNGWNEEREGYKRNLDILVRVQLENSELRQELAQSAKDVDKIEKENSALRMRDIPYQRLLGEYTGTLKGILAWDIPEDLKEKLRLKIKELEGK